jgi:hypothetical protein
MGPIEWVFIVVIVLWGFIGLVRGYQRELGVTTMLLLTLFALQFLFDSQLTERLDAALLGMGATESNLVVLQSLFAVTVLIIVMFISYQGVILLYPGTGSYPLMSFLVGLLNGYLFAGSIWYYLDRAGWPIVDRVIPDYTPFYELFVQLLPPAVFGWQFFILLAVAMLILRVLK